MSGPAVPMPAPDAHSPRRLWIGAAVIIVLTLVAYIPAIDAGFIWDDDDYLTGNTLLSEPGGLGRIWTPGSTHQYYPLVFTTFWIEHRLWGPALGPDGAENATGYHLVNVLLHLANALLVWRLFARLGIGGARGAWLAAAIFAVHPVFAESVAWITERKNVLSAFFYLLAAICYLRFDTAVFDGRTAAPGLLQGPRRRAGLLYVAALAGLLLALFAKTVTSTLPAALMLAIVHRHCRSGSMSWRRLAVRLAPTLPMLLYAVPLALHTADLERTSVGAVGTEFAYTFPQRILIASRALLFYPGKIVIPHPLIFTYPTGGAAGAAAGEWNIDPADPAAWWPAGVVVLAATALLVLFARGRRGPALAAAFYAGTILPALGFIDVYPMRYAYVADHFNYLAALGLLALVAGAVPMLLRRRPRALIPGIGLAGIVLVTLAILTWSQGTKYASAETLWRRTIAENPRAWMAHNNLGAILLRRTDPAGAEPHFRAALDVYPDHRQSQSNLALALHEQARYDEAIAQWDVVIRHNRADAGDRYKLALSLEKAGRIDDAIAALRQALTLEPESLGTHLRLGEILAAAGRPDEAQSHFELIVERDPANVRLRLYLGRRAEGAGDYAVAITRYGEALEHAPPGPDRDALMLHLAVILAMCDDHAFRDPVRAVALADELTRANGVHPLFLHFRAAALAGLGRFDDAIATAERAEAMAREMGIERLANEIAERLDAYGRGLTDPALAPDP